jgi:hypothetical protein
MPYAKDIAADLPAHIESVLPVPAPIERRSVAPDGDSGAESESEGSNGKNGTARERSEAERLIRDIGSEFVKLRKRGRSAAWALLEDKVATGGSILISTGMISSKDWVGMMIDIEQFRKAEGGSEELPGDALAKWLSEPEKKAKSGER